MAKRRKGRPKPPRAPLRSTVVPRAAVRRPPPRPEKPRPPRAPARRASRIIDPDDSTLLDVIDNLLSKGVVLNADVILAVAGVDLVYLRLSALLCAADRVIAPRRA
jgi:hypothetical protein